MVRCDTEQNGTNIIIIMNTGLYAEMGEKLGYLKKRGGQLQAASGGALEDNVKK